jgi:hypothetical protein
MDLALHPRFAENGTIYFTYSKGGPRGDTTTLATALFDGAGLTAVRDLFVADAWSTAGGNSGSRIAFGLDGMIYMSVGERHEQTPAQDLRTDKGKILRLTDEGMVPPDNPFVGRAVARPEIFAYGVRNPQGLFVDPATGTIWEHEHGPQGGDELNIIARGHNYGWPAITFGINYNRTMISKDTARAGMDQPVAYWVPSISPSGLTVYSGDRFPAWRGNVFLGALSGLDLRRLEVRDGHVTHQESMPLTPSRRRIRDVRQGPDGLLYVRPGPTAFGIAGVDTVVCSSGRVEALTAGARWQSFVSIDAGNPARARREQGQHRRAADNAPLGVAPKIRRSGGNAAVTHRCPSLFLRGFPLPEASAAEDALHAVVGLVAGVLEQETVDGS